MRASLLPLFCAVLVLGGCAGRQTLDYSGATSVDHSTRVQRLRWLERADPARDLAAAWARGDRRFVAVYDFSATVPGVPTGVVRPRDRGAVRFLEGTSDMPASAEEERLNALARDYAARYNRLLLARLHP